MNHPTNVERIADEIYDEYDPAARGKSPSVTRAAATYIAYM